MGFVWMFLGKVGFSFFFRFGFGFGFWFWYVFIAFVVWVFWFVVVGGKTSGGMIDHFVV